MRVAVAFLLLSSGLPLQPAQQAEIKRVEESLLAPCCYSQTIDKHMSGEAFQMRGEVTEMVARGMTEHEILEHYKALYGERILVVPDGRIGVVLFALPVVIFATCSGILYFFLRRMLRTRSQSNSLTTEEKGNSAPEAHRNEIDRQTEEFI
jgi:cytochrome c-type biogenesis protein CcmH